MTRSYRYVMWERVEDFMMMGWMIGNPASEHSAFCWACVCNPLGEKVPQHGRDGGRDDQAGSASDVR